MSLTLLGSGIPATIIGLSGNTRVRKYLTELGFIFGKKIEVLQHSHGNNIIVALGEVKMAMDRRMAHHVHIALEKEDETCQHKQQ